MTQLSKVEEEQKEISHLKGLAKIAKQSGNYAQMSETTMLNIMMSARDLGISPYKALNGGFYVVNGKIAMSTSLMTDRIRKEGHSVKIPEWSSRKCVVMGVRKDNGDSVKIEFSWEDAVAAGLTGSPTWKKYPKVMLYNRAMSMLARVLFPDVVGNCYSEDEGEEIARNNWGSSRKKVEPIVEEVDDETPLTVEEAAAMLIENIEEISEKSAVISYLEYCQPKMPRSMREVVQGWVINPNPFISHFQKWCLKEGVDLNTDGNYSEEIEQQSLLEDLA